MSSIDTLNTDCLKESQCINLLHLIQPLYFQVKMNESQSKSFIFGNGVENLLSFSTISNDHYDLSINFQSSNNESLHNLVKNFEFIENNEELTLSKFICECLVVQHKCYLDTKRQEYTVKSDIAKNIYLVLYILLIIIGLIINLITFIILILDYRNSGIFKQFVLFFCKKSLKNCDSRINLSKIKYNRNANAVHLSNDALIILLLFSYSIIIFYVVPFQAYLFYVNKGPISLNCKISEFLKAFSVSLSIYSLVAMSLQRLFAIKFAVFLANRNNNKLFSLMSFESFLAFLKSIRSILYTFVFSRYYRHYLITTLLFLFTWMISISMGLYNMSNFRDEVAIDYEYFQQNIKCKFPPDLILSSISCTNTDYNESNNFFSIPDIIFVIILLLIPNLIVFSSYTWICYHIWLNSQNLMLPIKNNFSKFTCKNARNIYVSIKSKKNEFETKLKSERKNSNNKKYEENISNFNIYESKDNPSLEVSNNSIIKETNLDANLNSNIQNSESIKSNLNKRLQANPTTLNNYQFAIKKRNKTVTLTTCLMVVCFTICWTPFFIFPMLHSKILNTNTYNNLKVIIHLIGYSSAICNPAILIIKSKRFWVRLKKFKQKSKQSLINNDIGLKTYTPIRS